jgi:hypothetical protein
MPQLSLTDFVHIVFSSGSAKASKVARLKARPGYQPKFDFYKPLREAIIRAHKDGAGKPAITAMMETLSDATKQKNYPEAAEAYKRWWGTKTFEWFDPEHETFSSHGIDVRVNPELGLIHNGQHILVKLYFKKEPPLGKRTGNVILHVMTVSLGESAPPNTIMAVLDVRRKKLVQPTVPVKHIDAALSAELAYLAELWPNV